MLHNHAKFILAPFVQASVRRNRKYRLSRQAGHPGQISGSILTACLPVREAVGEAVEQEHGKLPDIPLTVLTEDSRAGCGYPVQPGVGYILHLRRDKGGEYSTGFCSGNISQYEFTPAAVDNFYDKLPTSETRKARAKHPSRPRAR
jgi:hypothetical protein